MKALPSDDRSFMDLPPIQPEVLPQGAPRPAEPIKQAGTDRNPEFLPPQASGATNLPPQPVATNTAAEPAQAAVAVPAPPPNPVSAMPVPQIADDVDLIEKEWVEKAKDIVQKTKHDPHVQSKELNKVKADYLKQRFNKTNPTKESA